MENLISEYRNRLNNINEMINSDDIKDVKKITRLKTKIVFYSELISKLKAEQKQIVNDKNKRQELLETIIRLYYNYKKTSDADIRDYLEKFKIVKEERHAGGKITKYYPLTAAAMKKLKEKLRGVSLTFDCSEVTTKAINGLVEWKTIPYLCKSSSRFFLKPDIGEIFDAIDYDDLHFEDVVAICFNNECETLPNTEGEHHLMHVKLLKRK